MSRLAMLQDRRAQSHGFNRNPNATSSARTLRRFRSILRERLFAAGLVTSISTAMKERGRLMLLSGEQARASIPATLGFTAMATRGASTLHSTGDNFIQTNSLAIATSS